MIKEIMLNEEVYTGNAEAGSSIKLSRLLEWFDKVKAAQNASYLKCVIASTNGCRVFNIADIMFDTALVHKGITYANGVKLAMKESSYDNAMTIAHAAELFEAIATLCTNNDINLDDVQVFTQAVDGKLSRFSWFYDDEFDTAYIVRNMNPRQAHKWLNAGAEVLADIAKTPKKTPASEEKELYQYWIELFGAEGAKDAWKQSYPGKRIPRVKA